MKLQKQTNKPQTQKKPGAISDRDRQVIDLYLETHNKSRSVMEIIPEITNQSQAVHVFNAIYDKKTTQVYLRQRRDYLANQKPGLTLYEMANEFKSWAMSDVSDFKDCATLEDVAKLPPEVRRRIQDVKIREITTVNRKGESVITKEIDFKLVKKDDALKEYAKLNGAYFADNLQKNNNGLDSSIMPLELKMMLTKEIIRQQKLREGTTIDVTNR